MVTRQPSIAIIGAGIGGLALAAALQRFGIEAQVYEQAAGFARVGAGIQMTPNAMKVLRGIGLEHRLTTCGYAAPRALNREWDTGEITNELVIAGRMQEQYGAPYLFMHRADLHEGIASSVPAGRVHRGRRLVGLTQGPYDVTLAFEDDSRVTVDAVIGADGVHSLVREIVVGPERPRFSGKVAYRTTYASSRLGDRQITPARTKWWGPDRHIVIYYTRADCSELYFVTSQPETAEWMTRESWSAKGDLQSLRDSYGGFHAEVQAVLAACPDVHKWALFERDPLPHWGSGRVVLLGDACHPMTPYMAQGAASALEDAVVLARCLAGVDADGIDAAFRRYEANRKPRASQIQQSSSTNTWMRHQTNPDWVYSYDAWTVPLT